MRRNASCSKEEEDVEGIQPEAEVRVADRTQPVPEGTASAPPAVISSCIRQASRATA